MHGGREEALIERGGMEGGKDKEKKEEEPLDPILMDDDQLKWILESSGTTRSEAPY
jgi:hypothetical protein